MRERRTVEDAAKIALDKVRFTLLFSVKDILDRTGYYHCLIIIQTHLVASL